LRTVPMAPLWVTTAQSVFPDVIGKVGGRSLASAESSLAVHIGLRVKSPA